MYRNLLKPKRVSSTLFTYLPKDKKFVCDISDLGPIPFERVWADSCDEGLTLVSEWTGREIIFAITGVHEVEGEITHWTLKPVYGQPSSAPIEIVIFND